MGWKTGKKRLLWIVAGLFLSLILLYLARPLYLPDRYIRKQIETRISSALGMDVRIGKGRFNLLSRAELSDIVLGDSSSSFDLAIAELSLHYRLLPLLRRQLIITDFNIIRPRINFRKGGSSAGLSSSLPAPPNIKPSAAFAAGRADTTAAVYVPPLSVVIERFHVIDGELRYRRSGAGERLDLSAQGLNFTGEDLSFESTENLQIPLRLVMQDTLRVSYQRGEKSVHITAPTDLSAEIRWTPTDNEITLKATLTPVLALDVAMDATKKYPVPALELRAEAAVLEADSVRIDDLWLSSGKTSYLRAEGTCFNLFDRPDFDFRVRESRIDLADWWGILNEVAPLFGWDRWLRRRFFSGGLRFTNTRIKGMLQAEGLKLQAEIRWNLDNVTYRDDQSGVAIVGLHQEGAFTGAVLPPERSGGNLNLVSRMEEVRLPGIAGMPLLAEPLFLRISGSASPGLTNVLLDIEWKEDASGFPGSGKVRLRTDSLDLADPAASRNLSLTGGGMLKGLSLADITSNVVDGTTDIAVKADLDGEGNARLNFDGAADGLRFEASGETIAFDRLPFSLSLLGKINASAGAFKLDSIRAKVPPYITFKAATKIQTGTKRMAVSGDLHLDMGAVYSVLGSLLPQRWRNLRVNGIFAGDIQAVYPSENTGWNADLQLHSGDLSLFSPQDAVSFRTPDFTLRATTGERGLEISAALSAGVLGVARLRSDPYQGIKFKLAAFYDAVKEQGQGTVAFSADTLGLQVDVKLTTGSSVAGKSGETEIRWKIETPREILIARDWYVSGKAAGKGRLILKPDAVLSLAGELTADDLNLRRADDLSVRHIRLRIPFRQRLNLDATPPEFSPKKDIAPLSDPILFASFEHLLGDSSRRGTFSCSALRFGNYTLENLRGKVFIENGALTLPVFRMQAYGGVIQGSLFVDCSAADPDSVRHRIQLYGLNLDTALLPHARRRASEGSKISAFAQFSGTGINPEAHFELNGSLDITHIGRRVSDNILRFLDPDQKDPSVQTYRNYLRRGWGIKMFSFEMKDDFVYASITPSKPALRKPDQWLLSRFIGLGKTVNFSRVPLKFFLASENF